MSNSPNDTRKDSQQKSPKPDNQPPTLSLLVLELILLTLTGAIFIVAVVVLFAGCASASIPLQPAPPEPPPAISPEHSPDATPEVPAAPPVITAIPINGAYIMSVAITMETCVMNIPEGKNILRWNFNMMAENLLHIRTPMIDIFLIPDGDSWESTQVDDQPKSTEVYAYEMKQDPNHADLIIGTFEWMYVRYRTEEDKEIGAVLDTCLVAAEFYGTNRSY